jgi:hypothetical protein
MRLPRVRITVLGLMAAVAAAAVATWRATDQPKRREKAIAAARGAGGFVQFDGEHGEHRVVPKPAPSTAVAWQEWLGPGFAHEISVVSLDGAPVTDADLAALEGLAGLRRLYLNGTPVTDAELAHLRGLPALEVLELRETAVGDEGLRHLAGLPRLSVLLLYGTRVTDAGAALLAGLPRLEELSLSCTSVGDAGLAALAGCPTLRVLRLSRTGVTDAGVAAFQRARPGVLVIR